MVIFLSLENVKMEAICPIAVISGAIESNIDWDCNRNNLCDWGVVNMKEYRGGGGAFRGGSDMCRDGVVDAESVSVDTNSD